MYPQRYRLPSLVAKPMLLSVGARRVAVDLPVRPFSVTPPRQSIMFKWHTSCVCPVRSLIFDAPNSAVVQQINDSLSLRLSGGESNSIDWLLPASFPYLHLLASNRVLMLFDTQVSWLAWASLAYLTRATSSVSHHGPNKLKHDTMKFFAGIEGYQRT